jgi:EmrB/QacA subfamily drug resistance transporter
MARPARHSTRILVVLGLATLSYALAQTMIVPAFPVLAEGLHTDASGAAWTLTGTMLAAAVCTPIFGRLGDMFGKRRMLVVALTAFLIGSLISAASNLLWVVVAGRVVQGIGGGVLPLCFGIIRDHFPREQAARGVGVISATVGIGGGLGLTLGGLISDRLSYHWIFWLGAIIASILAPCAYLFLPESPVRTRGRVDVRGAVLLAVGLVLVLFAISQAPKQGWLSARTLVVGGAGLLVLVSWIGIERRTAEPLVNMTTLARPPVLMANVATLLVSFGQFGAFILVPQLAEAPSSTGYGFGVDATTAGLLLVPGMLSMLVFSPLSGALGNRFGNKVPLALGGAISACGAVALAYVHGSMLELVCLTLVVCIGAAFAFAAMPNLIMEAAPREQTGEATGVNGLVRQVGSTLGAQVTATVLATSALASGLPQEIGYTRAFLVTAGVNAAAAVVATLVPRARRHVRVVGAEELAIAEELVIAEPLAPPVG